MNENQIAGRQDMIDDAMDKTYLEMFNALQTAVFELGKEVKQIKIRLNELEAMQK